VRAAWGERGRSSGGETLGEEQAGGGLQTDDGGTVS